MVFQVTTRCLRVREREVEMEMMARWQEEIHTYAGKEGALSRLMNGGCRNLIRPEASLWSQ